MAVGIHAARYHRSRRASRASLFMRLAPARYHNAADIVDISRVCGICRVRGWRARYVYEVCIVDHL